MEPLQFRGGTSSRAQFSGFIGEASSISFGPRPSRTLSCAAEALEVRAGNFSVLRHHRDHSGSMTLGRAGNGPSLPAETGYGLGFGKLYLRRILETDASLSSNFPSSKRSVARLMSRPIGVFQYGGS
jgi:hypothetical protein